MDITRRKIAELADERRYDPELVETTVRLLDILDAFAADDVVSPRMALKGGTALNAFHLPLPRLSFDIDINYVGARDWSEMMDDKPKFESRVISIMESKGYRVQNAPPKGRGKWTFRCAAAMGGETSLHVDFNYQARTPIFGVRRLSSAPFGDYRAHDVPVLDVHEVIGGKLNALAARVKARDLFDANTIVDTPGLDLQKIRLAGMVYGMTNTNDDWRKVTSARIDGSEKDIRDSLLPCLPDGYFDAFGGIKAWLDRSVDKCRRELAPMYEFDEKEMAFMNAFLDKGRLDASLLDGASREVREAIQSNPVLHRIGTALQEGRFTITSAPEKERRREDMELQLACALTERLAPSGDDDQFHRKLGKPVRDALASARKTVGVSQEAVDDLAAKIARARAEADLRVELTQELSDAPLHEFRARFEGHPGFSRGDMLEPYDAAIKERMKELDRKGVVPNDLEQVVARAAVVSEGTGNADTAGKMVEALKFGSVPEAAKIREKQQALLAELAEPREDAADGEKVRLSQRIYRCMTFVETRQICDGRGPLLRALKSDADRSQVVANFKALHDVDIAGLAPWAVLHSILASTLGDRNTSGGQRIVESGTERTRTASPSEVSPRSSVDVPHDPANPEVARQRLDRELQLACALTERIAPSEDDDQFHRKLGKPVRDALAAAGKTVGVSQEAVDDLATEIARARAEAEIRVELTQKLSDAPLHEFRARFEGHPGFSRGDMLEPYGAAIKERMKELDRKEVVPNDLERVVARAAVVSEGTGNADTAGKMVEALKFGAVPEAAKIREERQALLAELAEPREDATDGEKVRLAQRIYRCMTFDQTREICDGRGSLLKALKSDADRSQVVVNFKALHDVDIAGPAPWGGLHRQVAQTLGVRTVQAGQGKIPKPDTR